MDNEFNKVGFRSFSPFSSCFETQVKRNFVLWKKLKPTQVRQLRGETSDIDDLVEQAEEYLAELNEKYDFEMSKRSENGKSSSKMSNTSMSSSKASSKISKNSKISKTSENSSSRNQV